MAKHFTSLLFLTTILASLLSISLSKSVTYPLIGTFTDHDFYDPTWRPIVWIPQSPEKIRPTFFLFNPEMPHNPEKLIWNDVDSLKETKFNPKLKTKAIIHGWLDSTLFGKWMAQMKDNFLKIEDCNVILVDWRHGDVFEYGVATANTRVVGAMLGVLIGNLCKAFDISPESFHVLGHSLGAHVAAYAGKKLNGTLGHITGFDPAGPYFEGLKDHRARLWHTDAKFVESIHTDAHHLIDGFGFGMYETCSHVDIYPNGGVSQPGCDQERWTSIATKGLIEGLRRFVACNHQRSVDFYLESMVNPEANPLAYVCEDYDSFQNGQCTSCGHDGKDCVLLGPKTYDYKRFVKDPKVSQGRRFFMTTGPHSRFLRFQYSIHVNMAQKSEKLVDTHGDLHLIFEDIDGHKQKVVFNQSNGILRYGERYGRVVVCDVDPTKIGDELQVKFVHGHRNMEKWYVYVDSIDLVPLSVHEGEKIPEPMKFVPDDDKICNKHPASFRRR